MRQYGCLAANTIFDQHRITPAANEQINHFKKIFLDVLEASLRAEGITNAEQKSECILLVMWGFSSEIRSSKNTRSIRAGRKELAHIFQFLKNESL